ncbi:MAG: glycosyltransferase [Firmicutes bacterium]|nr:glycosyltransferase [Bacillota bacterium]
MHICHVILTHSFAGSERYAIELANAQSAEHEVTVILHRRGCEQRANALRHRLSDSVRVLTVSGPKWWASWQAKRLLRQLQPDVAHAHLSAACKALKGLDGPLRLATLHIHYKPSQHAHLDAVIAIAPWQLDALPSRLRLRAIQIDNWTSAAMASNQAREAMRQQWGAGPDDYVFGALGRIEPSKGHDTLLAAYAQIADDNTKLVVVGDGSALPKLRAELPMELQSKVIFHGFSAHPQQCLAGFDGFVSAARSEPFGLVFLEAMVARLPIVATASQGASYLGELFQHPVTPVDDAAALAKAMATLRALGKTPIQRDLTRFDVQQRCADVVAFYRQQIEHS